jgi:hypothetical protein
MKNEWLERRGIKEVDANGWTTWKRSGRGVMPVPSALPGYTRHFHLSIDNATGESWWRIEDRETYKQIGGQ